jgi:hypothetical protein
MRHQPALEPVGDGPARGGPAAGRQAEAMCMMLDGTWQLVRVTGWRKAGGGRWECLLQWGVLGVVYEGLYVHDPGRLIPVGGSM